MTESRLDPVPSGNAIGWQLAMAFGQGVGGTMMATQGALERAFDSYGRSLQSDPEWPRLALVSLEFARVLGRLSAAHALGRGRAVIEVGDVDDALDKIRVTHPEPLGDCPITNRSPTRV